VFSSLLPEGKATMSASSADLAHEVRFQSACVDTGAAAASRCTLFFIMHACSAYVVIDMPNLIVMHVSYSLVQGPVVLRAEKIFVSQLGECDPRTPDMS
jgi:hypothetical protein